MRVLVLGNGLRPGVPEAAERLLPFVRRHAEVVCVDLYQEQSLCDAEADLTLVLGGDVGSRNRYIGFRVACIVGGR